MAGKSEKELLLIFVDIDGVMNRCERLIAFTLDDVCLANFADFVHAAQRLYEVQIYLASSWRRGMAKDMKPESSSPQMAQLLEKFQALGLTLSGCTPVSNRPENEVRRDDEIRHKIRQIGATGYRVLTIDDDEMLYSDRKDDINLYLTDYKQGFTKADAKKLLKMLRSLK